MMGVGAKRAIGLYRSCAPRQLDGTDGPADRPRYNGAPEQEFAACRLDDDGNRTMVQLRWGLVPSWARDVRGTRLINAGSETIHTKPSFGAAFGSRRCLVPADGWFEWQRTGYGKLNRPGFPGDSNS